jgi:glucokinase
VEFVLGLDIGGTKLAAGVVDDAGRARSFLVVPTQAEQGPGAVLDRLGALGRKALAEAGGEVEGVGIGCGGPLDLGRGVLLAPLHLPGWRDVPIVAWARETFGVPAALDNDGAAAAVAEHRYGAGAGTRDMVFLTLSTGVGGGIVVDGRVRRGSGGNGGELGHVVVDRHGRPCRGCGGRGCLEAYVSGTSIAERAAEARRDGTPSALPERPTAADVATHAAEGDAVAAAVWAETREALAVGLTSIVNVLEPEVIVLGGGVTRAGEALVGPVRAAVRAAALSPAGRRVRVERAVLGDRVGVIGAAVIGTGAIAGGAAS